MADAALFTLTATGSDPQAVYDTLLAAIEVYPAAATTILGDTQIQVIDQPVEPSAAPINANTARRPASAAASSGWSSASSLWRCSP